jgi:glycosyltransferase involved in cell wall biosynthesis
MESALLIASFPYLILILNIFRGLTNIRIFTPRHEPATFVSVVVACRNEEENITHLLDLLSKQNYPVSLYEVIIIDDNSSDRTYKTASEYQYNGRISVIRNDKTGKKWALNTGIKRAEGDLIVTTDADCSMGKEWLRSIAAFYEENKPDLIICPVRTENKHGVSSRFSELEFLGLQGVTAGAAVNGNSTMCNGANLSFTAEAYKKHSGDLHYEIPSGDDIFLLHSIKKDKKNSILWLESHEAAVTIPFPGTLGSFLAQRIRWLSKWKVYNDPYTIVLAISTLIIVISLLLSAGLSFFDPRYISILAIILGIKSIPDYLILHNTSKRYGQTRLMRWFIPSQIIYPFYVLSVAVLSLLYRPSGKFFHRIIS